MFILTTGAVFEFIADIGLSYTSKSGTVYNGDVTDLMFIIAMFLLSAGINLIDTKKSEELKQDLGDTAPTSDQMFFAAQSPPPLTS